MDYICFFLMLFTGVLLVQAFYLISCRQIQNKQPEETASDENIELQLQDFLRPLFQPNNEENAKVLKTILPYTDPKLLNANKESPMTIILTTNLAKPGKKKGKKDVVIAVKTLDSYDEKLANAKSLKNSDSTESDEIDDNQLATEKHHQSKSKNEIKKIEIPKSSKSEKTIVKKNLITKHRSPQNIKLNLLRKQKSARHIVARKAPNLTEEPSTIVEDPVRTDTVEFIKGKFDQLLRHHVESAVNDPADGSPETGEIDQLSIKKITESSEEPTTKYTLGKSSINTQEVISEKTLEVRSEDTSEDKSADNSKDVSNEESKDKSEQNTKHKFEDEQAVRSEDESETTAEEDTLEVTSEDTEATAHNTWEFTIEVSSEDTAEHLSDAKMGISPEATNKSISVEEPFTSMPSKVTPVVTSRDGPEDTSTAMSKLQDLLDTLSKNTTDVKWETHHTSENTTEFAADHNRMAHFVSEKSQKEKIYSTSMAHDKTKTTMKEQKRHKPKQVTKYIIKKPNISEVLIKNTHLMNELQQCILENNALKQGILQHQDDDFMIDNIFSASRETSEEETGNKSKQNKYAYKNSIDELNLDTILQNAPHAYKLLENSDADLLLDDQNDSRLNTEPVVFAIPNHDKDNCADQDKNVDSGQMILTHNAPLLNTDIEVLNLDQGDFGTVFSGANNQEYVANDNGGVDYYLQPWKQSVTPEDFEQITRAVSPVTDDMELQKPNAEVKSYTLSFNFNKK